MKVAYFGDCGRWDTGDTRQGLVYDTTGTGGLTSVYYNASNGGWYKDFARRVNEVKYPNFTRKYCNSPTRYPVITDAHLTSLGVKGTGNFKAEDVWIGDYQQVKNTWINLEGQSGKVDLYPVLLGQRTIPQNGEFTPEYSTLENVDLGDRYIWIQHSGGNYNKLLINKITRDINMRAGNINYQGRKAYMLVTESAGDSYSTVVHEVPSNTTATITLGNSERTDYFWSIYSDDMVGMLNVKGHLKLAGNFEFLRMGSRAYFVINVLDGAHLESSAALPVGGRGYINVYGTGRITSPNLNV